MYQLLTVSFPLRIAELTADDAKLFVANITFDTTDEDIRDCFSSYGNLTEIRIAGS